MVRKFYMGKILSVIVPSYNMEAYLPKCLGSLIIDGKELQQKLDVIVVNDGSKDRTSEIAHEFESKYPGVFRVIDKPNGNYGSCINAALPMVEGVFVKVLDADDWFDTDSLLRFIQFLEEVGRNADLVLSDYDTVDQSGEVQEHHTYGFPNGTSFGFHEFSQNKMYLSMHAYTYRSEILKRMGYCQVEGVSYSDTEWIWVPMACVKDFRYFPIVVYKYLRGREGQTMAPEVRAKNFWMQTEVYLHAAGQVDRLTLFASDVAKRYVENLLVEALYGVYSEKIFGDAVRLRSFDIERFDQRLKEASGMFYKKVGRRRYARRLSCCIVDAWRRKSIFLPLMIRVCRLYTKLAMRGCH